MAASIPEFLKANRKRSEAKNGGGLEDDFRILIASGQVVYNLLRSTVPRHVVCDRDQPNGEEMYQRFTANQFTGLDSSEFSKPRVFTGYIHSGLEIHLAKQRPEARIRAD